MAYRIYMRNAILVMNKGKLIDRLKPIRGSEDLAKWQRVALEWDLKDASEQ